MHTSSLEKPTRRRDPLRWIALGALLLAFVLICCVSQVVTYLMTPRNQASDLDLLSKNQADYSVWLDELWLPNIGPEVVEAIASDLATPTPGEVAALPAVPLEVVPAVPGAPTPTPAAVNPVIVTLTPTPTQGSVIAEGPTSVATATAVVSQPQATSAPTSDADVPIPTPTAPSVEPPTSTVTSATSAPPTNTAEPEQPPTVTPRPDSPSRPTSVIPTDIPTEPPTSEPPTSEPPTSAPPTSEPPTSEPPTSEPPTSTRKPEEPPRRTNTPVTPTNTPTHTPPPTNTPTHTPPPTNTPTHTPPPTPTDTPPPTPTDTPTHTPPPTNTPTHTPPPTNTPTPTPVLANLTITKSVTPSSMTPGDTTLAVVYEIQITNNSPFPVTLTRIIDNMSAIQPFDGSGCQMIPNNGTCLAPILQPGTWEWNGSLSLNMGANAVLRIEGVMDRSLAVSTQYCNTAVVEFTYQGNPDSRNTPQACFIFN